MKYSFLILSLLLYCFSCRSKRKEPKSTNIGHIHVSQIGDIEFRRTFADIQFIKNEKEIDAYVKKQEISNPIDMGYVDSNNLLAKRFLELGYVVNTSQHYELLLNKFKFETDSIFSFSTQHHKPYTIRFFSDSSSTSTCFIIASGADSIVVDTKTSPLQDLDYVLLDIIPGGNLEMVFLNDYYIMNGYNFELKVYKID
ncbi:hypothetical protein ESA94_12965 [Lacibacter luteus]|uniref:Uncharacterized protein n=1 Tax=Lacibacter luteus TaxID=2508719 RepID=A0A4V1M7I1_9BACT|nr:hypothetical protein [Lacibacter luteus]RXK59952.1 hypothetical protein ESA94_12965 [Lacibacter luteus]